MRVKRYVVNALPEAVSMIKNELGKDAVILNTKEIKVGGFMGMFRKKKMEVIAAIESNPSKPAAKQLPQQQPHAPRMNAAIEQLIQGAQMASTAVLEAPETDKQPPKKEALEREQYIIDEIRDLRQMMVRMASGSSAEAAMTEALGDLKRRLEEQEMDVQWRERLIQTILDKQMEGKTEFTREQVWELASEQIGIWLQPFAGHGISTEARVVHFVGPTGVGKTTTIAKLAAEQTIKQGRKVGFITSDTYRIAAVDQLRTYANILNVPLEVVFSPMDLPKAFGQLTGCELIYMDTAGRNFRSELHVSEVNSLLQSNEPSETVLVLSMTGKTKDMADVAEHFRKYGVSKVLFTKLDETSVYGAIFNLVMCYELYPTYLASGQTVPDDIDLFDIDTYIQLLLGSKSR
ncbi:flagellar biosynthesis protein FlhF [Paenibacillus sp. N4]|uniref:flagellar biosynthesis protein FlhF n=1 Tax=Paenibacillus vietnamensis TaxID=2590547 RepID=UPI001CD0BBE6|nr:flagellar biosynthesis protein FlhF [Paenibacillus vietnamensis]MCA0754052.1 flagellar biosynthesis protein FlhF [Paenibacillus vietnamensis]